LKPAFCGKLFRGGPIRVRYGSNLLDTAGNPAHAATYIRRREIVLDEELRADAVEHERILLHEMFHFVWVRLGNSRRLSWEGLLRAEWQSRARGEAGWSAEWRKRKLAAPDVELRTRAWREYCCESFCDTAASILGGGENEVTLAAGRRRERGKWYALHVGGRELPI
jgi:hypothetical protein